jgi:hypothetical protein
MFRQLETSISVWKSLDSSSNFGLVVDLFGSLAGIRTLDFAGRDTEQRAKPASTFYLINASLPEVGVWCTY